MPYALSIVRKAGLAYSSISAYPTPVRLAMEMALHEDAERQAVEVELAELVTAWREAERVAGLPTTCSYRLTSPSFWTSTGSDNWGQSRISRGQSP